MACGILNHFDQFVSIKKTNRNDKEVVGERTKDYSYFFQVFRHFENYTMYSIKYACSCLEINNFIGQRCIVDSSMQICEPERNNDKLLLKEEKKVITYYINNKETRNELSSLR